MTIDPEGPVPLWQQVAGIIRQQIDSGELPKGRRVPSENTLAQQYGIARGTAKRALDSLVADRLVVRVQGKGSFVA